MEEDVRAASGPPSVPSSGTMLGPEERIPSFIVSEQDNPTAFLLAKPLSEMGKTSYTYEPLPAGLATIPS